MPRPVREPAKVEAPQQAMRQLWSDRGTTAAVALSVEKGGVRPSGRRIRHGKHRETPSKHRARHAGSHCGSQILAVGCVEFR